MIVRTAAEGASEEELRADVERLTAIWEQIKTKADGLTSGRKGKGGVAPTLLHGEPDMTVRVIGTDLQLMAMTEGELRLRGRIAAVELRRQGGDHV